MANPDFPSKQTTNVQPSNKEYLRSPSGIYLPSYSLYLIGFFYILLLIIIGVLGFLLYRNKVNRYKIMKTPSSQEGTMPLNYSPQTSIDTTGYIHLDVLNKKKSEENYTIHALDENNSENPQNDKKINIVDKQFMITKELQRHRPLKKNGQHNIMLKDEINKICQNELSKSQTSGNNTSLKDLQKLIYEESRSQPVDIYETSPTSPFDEHYDEIPKRRPVNQENIDVANIPMYDCLPTNKNVIVRDSQTEYLFPVSRGMRKIDNSQEPVYINAHY